MPARAPHPVSTLPIALGTADVAHSRVAGRVVFVVDPRQHVHRAISAALRDQPDVAVPTTGGLFDHGLNHVLGNYLVGGTVGGGISSLAGPLPFLMSVRRLADDVYSAGLRTWHTRAVVDTSPASLETAMVVRAVYPDAPMVLVDLDDDDPRATQIVGPDILRLSRSAVERNGADLARWILERLDPSPVQPPPPSAPTAPEDGEAPATPGLIDRLILVVGCPRSGTTWLERLIGAHDAVGGPGKETAIFESLGPLWELALLPDGRGLSAWLDRDELIGAVRSFCDALFSEHLSAAGQGAEWFVEKTPYHGLCLELITAVYPDAWITSIHRDGRDVVRSLLEVSFGLEDAAAAAATWSSMVRKIDEDGRRCPRFRDIRYEDLLGDPVGRSLDLMRWIGLPIGPETEARLSRGASERVSRYGTTGEVGAGKWADLSPREVRAVYRHAGDQLAALGYVEAGELAAARSSFAYRVVDLPTRALRALRRRG